MRALIRLLYAAAAKLVGVASGLIPPTDVKAAIAIRARHGIRKRYAHWGATERDQARPLLWMHAPSVGEGLMARPVLTLIRHRRPEAQLAYTFFSPSAADFAQRLDVDFCDYLPFDDATDMKVALDALAPRALVFSKVDVWPELVRQARRRSVPLGMISAVLAPGSRRRSSVARFLLNEAYAQLDAVGAVDQPSAERLAELGVRPDVIEITGDTQFDQVWQRAESTERNVGLLARLVSDRPTLVAGSTWPADEAQLLSALVRVRRRIGSLRVILAPHEVAPAHLEAIEGWARQQQLTMARVDQPEASEADVILVHRYGILAELYALADVAFVGGGFHDAGLHSVLEPAVFGAPVLFGPRHRNSRDALLLIAASGARGVAGADELEKSIVAWFEDPDSRQAAGARARAVVESGRGAAEKSAKLVERLMS